MIGSMTNLMMYCIGICFASSEILGHFMRKLLKKNGFRATYSEDGNHQYSMASTCNCNDYNTLWCWFDLKVK